MDDKELDMEDYKMEVYCMKCKAKRQQINTVVSEIDSKRGKVTLYQGTCDTCGSKTAMISKKKKEA